MKVSTKFKEYIWLVNTIYRARKISFAQLQEKWLETEMSGGVELARSTFNRHKDAIEDIFGIYIDCDRKDGYRYFIGNPLVLEEDTMQNWMLSTLSVNNVLSESLVLQHRILLEQVPSAGEHLRQMLHAMKRSVMVEIVYQRYGSEEQRRFSIAPYCLKLFKQRWYVLGCFHPDLQFSADDYCSLFSFDRIREVHVTETRFSMNKDFDAKNYFGECFGVVVGDGTRAEEIVLRAYSYERFNLRDLPLHPSQQLLEWTEDHADYRLFLRPTKDFLGHLLSRSVFVKVLSPQWLADEVHKMHLESALLYEGSVQGQ